MQAAHVVALMEPNAKAFMSMSSDNRELCADTCALPSRAAIKEMAFTQGNKSVMSWEPHQ